MCSADFMYNKGIQGWWPKIHEQWKWRKPIPFKLNFNRGPFFTYIIQYLFHSCVYSNCFWRAGAQLRQESWSTSILWKVALFRVMNEARVIQKDEKKYKSIVLQIHFHVGVFKSEYSPSPRSSFLESEHLVGWVDQ